MTIGVVWEFSSLPWIVFSCWICRKIPVVHTISSVMLDPDGGNVPYMIRGITDTAVERTEAGAGSYLDIGLIDTMKDLLVNFIGAAVFSFIGYFYVKNRGKGNIVKRLVPSRKIGRPGLSGGGKKGMDKRRKGEGRRVGWIHRLSM